ncbi:MAG: AAA family ATPase [Caldilineales bacterium]|nr:AAA family ATPase [Caldilineales bacterium]MDW8317842.1 AAA family ATPase [Anaerolineae bacterium]
MRFSHIRLENWKNFSRLDAALQRRVFLIGPNASGKSNLLDAFRFLRDVALGGLRRATEDARGGVSTIRCLAARRYSSVLIEVEAAGNGDTWQYRLEFNQDQQRHTVVKSEVVWRNGQMLLQRPDQNDQVDPVRLTQTALEQISANQAFRELADFFKSVSYQHLLPQVVRDPRSFSPLPVTNDPYGRDFLLRLWQTSPRTRDARLRKILGALKVAVPQLTELKAFMDDTGVPHLEGRYQHWRPHDARQNESQFSDGTLRLLGLLWAMFEGSGPLLLEEPEISLHPEIVRRLPTLFEQINRERKDPRQTIISTHSRDLLSDPGIGAEEVLLLEPGPDGTVLRPLEEADLAAFRAGLTAADVLLPKAAPQNIQQMLREFS